MRTMDFFFFAPQLSYISTWFFVESRAELDEPCFIYMYASCILLSYLFCLGRVLYLFLMFFFFFTTRWYFLGHLVGKQLVAFLCSVMFCKWSESERQIMWGTVCDSVSLFDDFTLVLVIMFLRWLDRWLNSSYAFFFVLLLFWLQLFL